VPIANEIVALCAFEQRPERGSATGARDFSGTPGRAKDAVKRAISENPRGLNLMSVCWE
jgi:hypothetical protein